MQTTVVTAKGQIVIPAKICQHFNIKKGTKVVVFENKNKIILRPLTDQYFEKAAGILKTKGKLLKHLLEERRREK